MRGSDRRSGSLFSYVDLEARVRDDHPLRIVPQLTDEALAALNGSFSALYAVQMSGPSIPPEMLLRAMLLQAFYSIRSEQQLMERLEYDLLFDTPLVSRTPPIRSLRAGKVFDGQDETRVHA
jgi:transposase